MLPPFLAASARGLVSMRPCLFSVARSKSIRSQDDLERLQPMKRVSLVFGLALAVSLPAQLAQAETLKTVKDRGMLSCGVSPGLPGFATPDDKGNWTGIDVDVC